MSDNIDCLFLQVKIIGWASNDSSLNPEIPSQYLLFGTGLLSAGMDAARS